MGRFNSIDPLANQRDWLTPYNYVQNNPLLKIDPSGELDDYYNGQGEFLYRDNKETDYIKEIDQRNLMLSHQSMEQLY